MEKKYLIWSNEDSAWWRKGSWGYTKEIDNAETYNHANAEFICSERNTLFASPKVEMIAEIDIKRIEEKRKCHEEN